MLELLGLDPLKKANRQKALAGLLGIPKRRRTSWQNRQIKVLRLRIAGEEDGRET